MPPDSSLFAFSGYRCYYCKYEIEGGKGSKSRYELHVKDKHGSEYAPYPNKSEIEKHGLEPQGKEWEI